MMWTKTSEGRRPGPAALAVTLLLASLGPAVRRAEAVYTVTDLGNLGTAAPTIAGGVGLNAGGQAVGFYSGGGPTLGFLASGGPMTSLGTLPGGSSSSATGINNNGVVVGYASTASGATDAFTYSNGKMTDVTTTLGITIGGTVTLPNAINAGGQIVGAATTGPITVTDSDGNTNTNTYTHAFLYDGTKTIDLGTLFGPTGQSHANAINAGGQVVGNTTNAVGWSHAFLYSNAATGMQDLGTIGNASGNSTGNDLNNAGQIVGESAFGDGSHNHAFLYNSNVPGSTMVDLTPTAFSGNAFGIDSAGDVVGIYNPTSALGSHGFLYSGGTFTDVNSLVAGSGWTITGAFAINDTGQILAIGQKGSLTDALLLSGPATLVPEPPTIALLCSGAVLGLGIRKFSRRDAAEAVAAPGPPASEG